MRELYQDKSPTSYWYFSLPFFTFTTPSATTDLTHLPILLTESILSQLSSTTSLVTMKSIILIGLFAIVLTSATDVGFFIAQDTNLRLGQQRAQASGSCRMVLPCFTVNWDANFYASYEEGIGPELDKQVSSISPNDGVTCSLFA